MSVACTEPMMVLVAEFSRTLSDCVRVFSAHWGALSFMSMMVIVNVTANKIF